MYVILRAKNGGIMRKFGSTIGPDIVSNPTVTAIVMSQDIADG